MHIRFNNEVINLPDNVITLGEFMRMREIPEQGTAIALNGKLVTHNKWEMTTLNDNDDILVISAAFGG